MKKVVRKLNRALSVLLAAAMITGSMPNMSLVAHAEEDATEVSDESAVSAAADDSADTSDETAPADETPADETPAEAPTDETPIEMPADEVSTETPADVEMPADETSTESEQDKDTQPETSSVEESTEEMTEGNTTGEEETTEEPSDEETLVDETGVGALAEGDFTATFDGDTDKVEIKVGEDALTGSTTTIEAEEGNTAAKDDFIFTVTPKIGYIEANGYDVKVAYKLATASGDEEATSINLEEDKYTIKKEEIKADITITVTVKKAWDVDITLNDATVQYSIDGSNPTTEYDDGAKPKVAKGDTLKLKVTTADGKVATVKKGEDTLSPDANGVYTITVTEETDVSGITVTVSSVFTVTVTGAKVGNTGIGNATLEFTDDCVQNGTIAEGTDLTFKVTPDNGYKIDSVKVGETVKTPNASDGIYTIAKGDINGDITITVSTVEIANYTVKFDTAAAEGTTVEYYNSGADNAGWKDVTTLGEDGLPVDKGGKITFRVIPAKEGDAQHKLRYVNTSNNPDDGMLMEPTESEDETTKLKTYTFTDYAVSGTSEEITIYVKASALKEYDVTFAYEPQAKKGEVTVSSVTTATADDVETKTLAAVTDDKFVAKEDTDAEFVVALKAGSKYKVTSVTIPGEDEEDTPLSGTPVKIKDNAIVSESTEDATDAVLYTLPAIAANANVKISLELDEEAEGVSTATFTVDGDEDAYTITIGDKEYSPKEGKNKLLTDESSITFMPELTNVAIYEITKVEAIYKSKAVEAEGETPAQPSEEKTDVLTASEEDGNYSFDFTKTDDNKVTIKVTAKTLGLSADRVISFDNRTSGNVSYEVETDENVIKTSGGYRLKKGTQYVTFTVNAKKNYTPTVSIGETELTGEAGTEKTVNGTVIVPYTYKVLAKLFETEETDTVNITGVMSQKTIQVVYDPAEAEVDYATLNGEDIVRKPSSATENGKTTDTWIVDTDSSLVMVVTAKDHCKLNAKYTVQVGEAEAAEQDMPANGRITVKAEEDTVVTIASTSEYGELLTEKGGEAVARTNTGYTVNSGVTYTASLLKGTGSAVAMSKVELLDKNNKAVTTEGALTFTAGGTSADINLVNTGNSAAKYTVKLYVAETTGTGEDATTNDVEKASFVLNVTPALSQVTIAGVSNGKVTQVVDTQKSYKITVNKNADIKNIGIETSADTIAEAEINDKNELVITTKPAKAADVKADAAVLKLYDKTVPKKDNKIAEEAYLTGGEISVTTAEPALAQAVPTAKFKTASDTGFTLTVGVPKAVTDAYAGKVWYKVEVTAPADADQAVKDATANPQYFAKEAGKLTQDIKVVTDTRKSGMGGAVTFTDVKVSLVQTLDDEELTKANETAKTAFTGKEPATVNAATREPAYDNKLSLKKGAATVYTGQENVAIATINFAGTYDDAYAYIINSQIGQYDIEDYIDLDVVNGVVEMSISKDSYLLPGALIGKHTIRVVAAEAEGAFGASATLTVNVVRGIERLAVSLPSDSIYMAPNKAGALTVTPVYNNASTDKAYVPKAKKVDYAVVSADASNDGNLDNDGTFGGGLVTVKNGKISVNKNYVVKARTAENQFKVRIIAKDYTGNTTVAYSAPITITDESLKLGDICIVKKINGQAYYTLVENRNLTSGQLYGDGFRTRIVALKEGILTKDTYTDADFIDSQYLTFKSNKGDLVLDANGYITNIKKAVRGVKVTVTANDGSKNKKELALDINADSQGTFGLKIEQSSNYTNDEDQWHEIYTGTGSTVTLSDSTADTVLRLTVVKQDEDGRWAEISQYTDFKWSQVKNVKVLTKAAGTYGQQYTVIANKAEATIKMKFGTAEQSFTINNPGVSSVKAPAAKTTDTLHGYSNRPQRITFKLSGANAADFNGKYVMVATDATERTKVKKLGTSCSQMYDYQMFEESMGNGHVLVKDNAFTLDFDYNNGYADNRYVYIHNGSYKLQLTFGDFDEDGGFKAETKAQTVTLKVTDGYNHAATKKGSYKPVTKVTMSATDKAGILLEGKKTGACYAVNNYYNDEDYFVYSYDYVGIADAHVAAGANTANNFTKFFELNNGYLKLKDSFGEDAKAVVAAVTGKNAAQITHVDVLEYITGSTPEAKNDRIGNAAYAVRIWDGSQYVLQADVAQITVSFTAAGKTINKYAVTKPTIVEGTETAVIDISAGKNDADMYWVGVDSNNTDGNFTIAKDADGDAKIYSYYDASKKAYGTRVKLALDAATRAAVGKHKVTLYVVPYESAYAEYINTLAADKRGEAVVTYGIRLETTVTITAKGSATGKITVNKSDLSQTFTSETYSTDGKQNYQLYVPYTAMEGMPYGIAAINNVTSNAVLKELVQFRIVGDWIVIEMNKGALASAVADRKTGYGKKLSIKTEVVFGTKDTNGQVAAAADDVKKENFTFSLTVPGAAAKSHDDAVKAAQDLVNNINDRVTMWLPTDGEITDQDVQSGFRNVIDQVYEELKACAPLDSDVRVDMVQISSGSLTVAEGDYVLPESGKSGSLKVMADLYDISSEANVSASKKDSLTYTVKTSMQQDISKTLEDFADWYTEHFTVSNDTSASEILTAARRYPAIKALLEENKDLRLTCQSFNSDDKAEAGRPGSIKVTLRIMSKRGSGEDVSKELTFVISALQARDDAVAAVTTVVNKEDNTDEALLKAYNATTDAIILNAAKEAVTNDQFTLEWKAIAENAENSGFTKEGNIWKKRATASATGAIEGTLILKDTQDEEDEGTEIAVDLEIAQLLSETDALNAVRGIVGVNESGVISDTDNLVALIIKGGNTSDGVKAAILAAAKEAVEGDGVYTVDYVADSFAYTPAGYKADVEDTGKGKISYTMELTQTADNEKVAKKVTVNETEFGPLTELQSFETAKEDLTAYLTSLKGTEDDAAYVDSTKLVALGGLGDTSDADNIKTEVEKEVAEKINAVVTGNGLSAEIVTKKGEDETETADITLTLPTYAEDGSISFKVALTQEDDKDDPWSEPTTETISFEAKIKRLTHADITAAATAVENIFKDSANITVSNDDITVDSDKNAAGITDAAKAKILEEASKAINTAQYTITIATEGEGDEKKDKVTVKLATLSDAGEITVTLQIAPVAVAADETGTEEPETKDITIKLEIASFETLAKNAIKAAAEADGFDFSAADAGSILLAAANSVLGNAYNAEYKDEAGYQYKDNAVSGTITLSVTDSSGETVDINLATLFTD